MTRLGRILTGILGIVLSALAPGCGSHTAVKTSYVLTVNSSNPSSGVAISVSPQDMNGAANGTTGFTRSYMAGTSVTLTAPATADGHAFSSWTGCTSFSAVSCTVAMSANTTVTAGYEAAPPSTPTVSVTPSATSITTAQALTVTVTASGASGNPIPTGSVTLTSDNYASAATTLTAGSTTFNIAAGSLSAGTDVLTATYTPDAASALAYSGATGTSSVTVTTAQAGAAIVVYPGSLTFVSQNVSSTSAPQTVTVTNDGTAVLDMTGITVSGDFAETTTCGTTLASDASCTISVTFTPTGSGTRIGNLTITNNTLSSPYLVSLSGTGVSGGSMPSGPGATLVFSYPNGFADASSAIQTTSDASQFVGSAIALTTGTVGQHEAGSAWYKTQQNIQAFTTDFTFQMASGLPVPSIVGITFSVQKSNSTTNPNASGYWAVADANLAGYGAGSNPGQYPIGNSIAVKFSLNNDSEDNYPSGGSPNSTGLYIDGGPGSVNNQFNLLPQNDLNPSGINLYSGDIMAGHVIYDGSLLTLTLRDTVTNAQFRTSWPVDIPTIVGSNSAWVGFTGGEIPAAANNLLTWSFSEGYAPRLPAPTFNVAAGSYTSTQNVAISGYPGATVYYTTDGQQPTSSSNVYTEPIPVSSSEVVQAIAIETGYTDSLVAMANYQIAPVNTPIISFPNGFANASGLVATVGHAQFNGSAIQLTDTANYIEAGAAWYVVPVNVQSFTTHFTLQLTNANANGMTFCIQNQNPSSSDSTSLYVSGGPYTIADSQDGLGYGSFDGIVGGRSTGLLSSVAVIFDLYNGSGDLTGLYMNGTNPVGSSIDMTSSGLSLHSGHPLAVTLTYNGTTLAMIITDTVTNASFSNSWTINIPATVGANTAYVGFTGATGGETANQDILSWTYSN